jgi:hypothetical protein
VLKFSAFHCPPPRAALNELAAPKPVREIPIDRIACRDRVPFAVETPAPNAATSAYARLWISSP